MVLVATQVKRRRGTTAENDAFTGAEGEIVVDTERHELRVHDGQTQGGFRIGGGSGSGRNIGDTFMTKRTDNTLNGAVECDGATYNTTDFTGDGSIGELLEAGKLDYVSLSAYSTAIAQTGWCDKIGWDGTGNTQFRVPTITPGHYIIKSQEPTAENNYTWYKLYADGWVEQGGQTSTFTNTASSTGQTKQVTLPISMANIKYTTNITFASDGGSISGYSFRTMIVRGKSTTGFIIDQWTNNIAEGTSLYAMWQVSGMSSITPQTNTRVMIQLFNSTTDEAVATVGGVLADVAGLKDLSNITADGKEVCANLAMPSGRYINLTLGASGATYTAPADGWLNLRKIAHGEGQYLELAGRVDAISVAAFNGQGLSVWIPVSKGEIIEIWYSASGITEKFRFIYAEGAQ